MQSLVVDTSTYYLGTCDPWGWVGRTHDPIYKKSYVGVPTYLHPTFRALAQVKTAAGSDSRAE